ncbi:MAG: acyl-CoA thioesterase [Acidimicrobiales bacterium]
MTTAEHPSTASHGTAAPGDGTSAFARQMALRPDADHPGRYTLDVDARWDCPVVPQGGTMAAIAARAMADELADPSQSLRSLTTVFANQVPAGPVSVDVSVLRRGRSMSQALATVRADGAAGPGAGHTTVAVFGQPRPGFEFTDVAMPDVPPPSDCPSFRDPLPEAAGDFERRPPFPFWENVEGRPALGHAPWDDYMPTSSDCACWYRFDEPPMLPDGTLDPYAVVALCDLMPSSVGERMGPGTPMWYPPSADLTVHLLGEARSEWLLAQLRARRAIDGYASVECALWDEPGQLVAHAAQVMFLSFPDGPPSPEQRVPFDQRD